MSSPGRSGTGDGITSNVRTRAVPDLESHPVATFHRLGVPITLNTDDRGILGIDLTNEYRTAARLGLGIEDLAQITLNGVESAFLSKIRKGALRAQFQKELKSLLKNHEKAKTKIPR